jgi:hypothetical protein
MSASRWTAAALSLLLLVCAGTGAWAAGWRERRAVEQNGWHVAYGNDLTEADADRGAVAPGVYIYADRRSPEMNALHDWADALVRQAEAKMSSSLGPASVRGLGQDARWQARRLTVRTVRDLLRSRSEGVSEIISWGGLEFKAGVLRYRGQERDGGYRDYDRRPGEVLFAPYVALRQRPGAGGDDYPYQDDMPVQGGQDDSPVQSPPPFAPPAPYPPGKVPPSYGMSSFDVLNALRLTNTARNLRNGRWQWTARIEGPPDALGRIRSVKYFLHPSFTPNVQYGNSTLPGHPLTATGWGVFQLKAEVTLRDGVRRTYQHMLRFR